MNEVRLEPVQPRVVAYAEPEPAPRHPVEQQPQRGPFIPPAAEMPVRPARMPTIDDLPLPGRNQLRAYREPQQQAPQPAAGVRRQTLFERLAAFGMSRHEEEQQRPATASPRAPQQQYAAPQQPNQVHAEYGKRPVAAAPRAQAPLDPHGRLQPSARPSEDDALEIPAFLRRQSS